MILALQTNTFGHHGGIPAYNRLVCRVLNDVKGLVGSNQVLIAMDDPAIAKLQGSNLSDLEVTAFGGKRFSFAVSALRTVVRKPVKLLLAGHVNYGPLCLILKRLRPDMRFGVVVYGWEVWDRLPLLRRHALQEADFVISISGYTKHRAAKVNGLVYERTMVLPNALEWSTNPSALESFSLPNGVKLLSVGRMDSDEQQKGFDTVIRSLSVIAQRVPDIQYIIVGTGTDLERHKELAMECGVADRVHFLGAIDENYLRACYESCDIFVMPSAQEGFGFVYLEAMQYAKPIVAANSAGAPEVVIHNETGRLVEYGDEEQLARALIELCLSPLERSRLGDAGYRRLQDRFTFPNFKRKLTEIIRVQLSSDTIRRINSAQEECAS